MSRKGNCFDNAAAENFFSHLKSELINRVKLKDYEEAKKAIDDYIRYYNNKRIQVKNGSVGIQEPFRTMTV